MTARHEPNGSIVQLIAAGYQAEIVSVGAAVAGLRRDGTDLIVPFAASCPRPAMRGAVLAPWPNRTAAGQYTYRGERYQLPITEPETGAAIHGLVAWLDWQILETGAEQVVLGTQIEPQPGYPWRVRLQVTYTLGEDGLSQRLVATNLSDRVAPFGAGSHPYLLAGDAAPSAIDRYLLQVPADQVLLSDPHRMLPTAQTCVDGTEWDFRGGQPLRGRVLNHAFTALSPVSDGARSGIENGAERSGCGSEIRVRLRGTDSRGTEMFWGTDYPWVQLYTADHLPGDQYRHAVAVEPMTCPPDALNSHRDLIELAPGAAVTLTWTIRAISMQT